MREAAAEQRPSRGSLAVPARVCGLTRHAAFKPKSHTSAPWLQCFPTKE